jgi:hypothetical protein
MAWETRARGGRYYTRSRKVGGRVVREYVGRGLVGELAAREDAARRAARETAAEARRRDRLTARALGDLVAGLDALADDLTSATLAAAGYHRHDRGAWRRRRGHDAG